MVCCDVRFREQLWEKYIGKSLFIRRSYIEEKFVEPIAPGLVEAIFVRHEIVDLLLFRNREEFCNINRDHFIFEMEKFDFFPYII